MSPRTPLSVAVPRLLAIAAWSGLLLQLWLSVLSARANGKSAIGGLIVYTGYFTILTNLFVALVCTAGSLRRRATALYGLPAVGCATTAILVVGIGYHTLLREVWAPVGAEWLADCILHYLVPIGALLQWLVYPYSGPARWWTPLSWCWYPLVYFAYVMTRGEILFSYPYPFIDVLALGHAQVLINAAGFLIGFIVLGYVLLWIRRIGAMVTGAIGEETP
jgi:hypothetical protein